MDGHKDNTRQACVGLVTDALMGDILEAVERDYIHLLYTGVYKSYRGTGPM